MMTNLVRSLALLTVVACVPPGSPGYAPAPQQPGVEPAQPEPAPDTRNEGQIVTDLLVQNGFACTAQETAWECTAPGNSWQFYVSYVPVEGQATTIWFDSYWWRAFAQPCRKFGHAVTDLADTASLFSVSCDDASQKWRFNTSVQDTGGLDVVAWANNHIAKRNASYQLLNSIQAVRPE